MAEKRVKSKAALILCGSYKQGIYSSVDYSASLRQRTENPFRG